MDTALIIIQTIIAILLVIVVLVQTRGTGFSRSFGSSGSFTRRGLERVVFRLTFVLTGIFIIVSILTLVV